MLFAFFFPKFYLILSFEFLLHERVRLAESKMYQNTKSTFSVKNKFFDPHLPLTRVRCHLLLAKGCEMRRAVASLPCATLHCLRKYVYSQIIRAVVNLHFLHLLCKSKAGLVTIKATRRDRCMSIDGIWIGRPWQNSNNVKCETCKIEFQRQLRRNNQN